jgi:hypothetical protein
MTIGADPFWPQAGQLETRRASAIICGGLELSCVTRRGEGGQHLGEPGYFITYTKIGLCRRIRWPAVIGDTCPGV